MTKEEFLTELQDILQRDEEILETDVLADYDEWDSLSKMSVMAFFASNFSVKIPLKELGELKTVKDLLDKAGL